MKLLNALRRLFPSLEPRHISGKERPVENVDAEASWIQGGASYPPNYVRDYDDGRPRK